MEFGLIRHVSQNDVSLGEAARVGGFLIQAKPTIFPVLQVLEILGSQDIDITVDIPLGQGSIEDLHKLQEPKFVASFLGDFLNGLSLNGVLPLHERVFLSHPQRKVEVGVGNQHFVLILESGVGVLLGLGLDFLRNWVCFVVHVQVFRNN